MTSIKSLKPDLIYYGGTTQTKGGQICKDMVAAGLKCKLMVPDGCMEDAFIEAAGAENANDRVYVTFGGVLPENQTGKGKKFVEKYKAKYGRCRKPTPFIVTKPRRWRWRQFERPERKTATRLSMRPWQLKIFQARWAPGRLMKTAIPLLHNLAAVLCTMENLNS